MEQDTKQMEENKAGVKAEYPYKAEGKVKECKYCRVMIPKKAKICPNCKSELKRHWFWNLLIWLLVLALLGVAAAGSYYFLYLPNKAVETAAVEKSAVPTDTASDANKADADSQTTESDTAKEENIQPTATIQVPDENEDKTDSEAAKEANDNKSDDSKADDGKKDVEKEDAGKADIAKTDGSKMEAAKIDTTEAAETVVPVEMTEVVLGETDMLGADGTSLDFADEEKLIFHDYCGLFVYSMTEQKITASFALEPIGCQYTQGDAACQVSVTEDGKMVYLHAADAGEMYLYDTEKNLLTKKTYSKNNMGKLFEAKETKKMAEPDHTVYRSSECAKLAKDTYLYLESGSGLFIDLCYVIEEDKERTAREILFTKEELEVISLKDGQRNDIEEKGDTEESKAEENKVEKNEVAEAGVESEDEQAYKESCTAVNYKALLRQTEEYLDTPVYLEVTLLEQVNGGLFDKNKYYLCVSEDKQGIERYWILRDDRAEEELLLLEGDTIGVYGALFDTCRLPADMISTQPVVPALSLKYCEILAE